MLGEARVDGVESGGTIKSELALMLSEMFPRFCQVPRGSPHAAGASVADVPPPLKSPCSQAAVDLQEAARREIAAALPIDSCEAVFVPPVCGTKLRRVPIADVFVSGRQLAAAAEAGSRRWRPIPTPR